MLFPRDRRAAWLAPLFLLLAFGPTYLRFFFDPAFNVYALHGQTSQGFLEQMLRRPFPVSFAVVSLILAQIILLVRRRSPRPPPLLAGLLAPSFFLVPQIAEEQLLVLGLLVAALVLGRRLSLVSGVAAAVGALAGGAFSGVFRSLLEPTTSMASPKVALLWPPALPNWQVPHGGAGFPSWLLLEVVLLEVGPLIAVAFVLLCRERSAAHRIVLSAIVLDLLAASCLTLRNWPRADLDRFVFHAANLTLLFLPALWGLSIVRRRRPWARRAILALTGLLLVAGSLPTAVDRFYTQARDFRPIAPERPYAQLRRVLGAVGPRDLIATDQASAQFLVTAGFLVVAPMDSHMVGVINRARYASYAREHRCRARWLWLNENDPTIAGRPAAASLGGYSLVANDRGCPPSVP